MKKVISLIGLSMMLLLVMVPMSFADEKVPNMDREERLLKVHEKNVKLYTNYNSEDLDEYLAYYSAHKSVHENLIEIREELKGLHEDKTGFSKEEAKVYRKKLGEKVKSEEITREEAKVMFEEFTGITKDDIEAKKAEGSTYRDDLEALKINSESNLEKRKEIKKEIFDNLLENNDDEVKSLMKQLLNLLDEHLEYDNEKLDILSNIINEQ